MSTFAEAFDAKNEEAYDSGPIPEGAYECTLRDVTTETNPMDNSVATTLEYEVIDGDHAKRRIWDKVKHEDNVAWKAAQIYRSYSLRGTPDDFDSWAREMNGQKGRQLLVEIAHRQSQDGSKTYTNVKRIKLSDKVPF